jgi:uncharacterized membrane protein YvlD (DUF360 family)
LVWAVDALSLLLTALATPGIQLVERAGVSELQIALSAALLLAIVNLSIRPAIILVAQPLGWIALLSIGFFVNALALWITALLLPGLQVSVLGGLLGGLIFAFFNAILTGILELNEEGSFFQGPMERRAREQAGPWFDDGGDRRAELLASAPGAGDGVAADAAPDDGGAWLSSGTSGLWAAVDDVGLPGWHHVWRQLRHSSLSLVRQAEAEGLCLCAGRP